LNFFSLKSNSNGRKKEAYEAVKRIMKRKDNRKPKEKIIITYK